MHNRIYIKSVNLLIGKKHVSEQEAKEILNKRTYKIDIKEKIAK